MYTVSPDTAIVSTRPVTVGCQLVVVPVVLSTATTLALRATPPMDWIIPPMYTVSPDTAIAMIKPVMLGFQPVTVPSDEMWARLLRATPPTVLKSPPM